MLGTITYFGEAMALLSAIVWALAVILFKKSGEVVHPVGLNLSKNALAAVLLSIPPLPPLLPPGLIFSTYPVVP